MHPDNASSNLDLNQHNVEINQNLLSWNKKPILEYIYKEFYKVILKQLQYDSNKPVVEIGSGVGNLKKYYPNCITTDLFGNPWIDQIEDAYNLSFQNGAISNLVLFDVFHHLEFPGLALDEFFRVLEPKGRVVIFDPCISFLGMIIYGIFHHEPIRIFDPIKCYPQNIKEKPQNKYYAAQGNAYRFFRNYNKKYKIKSKLNIQMIEKYSALAYLTTGGYSKKQLLSDSLIKSIKKYENVFDLFPFIFSTRMMIVLEK